MKVKGTQRTTVREWPDMNVLAAREHAQKLRTEIAGGRNPAEERASRRAELTFGELFKIFPEQYSRKDKRTWIQDQRKYNLYLRHLADRKLSTITADELSKLNDRIGTDSPYMANRVLELATPILGNGQSRFGRRCPTPCRSRYRAGAANTPFSHVHPPEPDDGCVAAWPLV